MSDIVERLRRFAREGAGVTVLIDAAEEIQRMRTALEALRDDRSTPPWIVTLAKGALRDNPR